MSMMIQEQVLSPDATVVAVVESFVSRRDDGRKRLCRIRLLDPGTGWSRLLRQSLGRACRDLSWSSDGRLLFFAHVGCPSPALEQQEAEWIAYDVRTRQVLRLPAL